MELRRKILLWTIVGLIVVLMTQHALGGGVFRSSSEDANVTDDTPEARGKENEDEGSTDSRSNAFEGSVANATHLREESNPPSTEDILKRLTSYERALIQGERGDRGMFPMESADDRGTELEREIDRLRAELEESRAETRSLRRALDEAKRDGEAELVEKLEALKREKLDLENRQDDYIQQIVDLKRSVVQANQRAAAMIEEPKEASETLRLTQARLDEAQRELEQLRPQGARLAVIEAELEKKQARYDKLLNTAQRFEMEIQRFRGLEGEYEQLKERTASLERKLLEAESKLAHSERKLHEMPGVQRRAHEFEEKAAALARENETLRKELNEMRDELARVTREHEAVEKRRDADFSKLQVVYDKAKTVLKEVSSAKERIEAELTKLKEDYRRVEEERNKLEAEKQALLGNLSKREQSLHDLEKEVESVRQALKSSEEKVVSLQGELGKLSSFESQLASCQGEVKSLNVQAQKIEQLQAELVKARNERNRAQNELLIREAELNRMVPPVGEKTTGSNPSTRGSVPVGGTELSQEENLLMNSGGKPQAQARKSPSKRVRWQQNQGEDLVPFGGADAPQPPRRNNTSTGSRPPSSADEEEAVKLLRETLGAVDRAEKATAK